MVVLEHLWVLWKTTYLADPGLGTPMGDVDDILVVVTVITFWGIFGGRECIGCICCCIIGCCCCCDGAGGGGWGKYTCLRNFSTELLMLWLLTVKKCH